MTCKIDDSSATRPVISNDASPTSSPPEVTPDAVAPGASTLAIEDSTQSLAALPQALQEPPQATQSLSQGQLAQPAVKLSASRAQLSVVMVTYQTGPILMEAIRAAQAQKLKVEIIVVNNGNPPDVEQKLKALADAPGDIQLVTGHGNVGFAAASNLGCYRATGTMLLMLNPDCVVPEDTAELLVETLKQLPPHSMVGADIRNIDGTPQRGSRRELPTPWLAFIELFRIYRLAPSHPYFTRLNRHQDAVPATTVPVPAISGAFMAFFKSDFCSIGGFDDGFFLHVEDLDFCLRWQTAGNLTWFTPDIRVLHHKSTSAASANFVEWHKTAGLYRYFTGHFRSYYPRGFMQLVGAGLIVRFVAGVLVRAVTAVFTRRDKSLAGLGAARNTS